MDRLATIRKYLFHPSGSNRSIESRAIYYAVGSAIVTFVICLIYFEGAVPLFEGDSIGFMAMILSTGSAFIGYYYAAYQAREKPRHTWGSRAHFLFTTFALAFAHAAIVFMLTTVIFFTVQEAFKGLLLDKYASGIIVAGTVATMSYGVYLVAAGISTLRISTALAVFLVTGALVSMITADDPQWWAMHLSSLGAGNSLSSHAFDLTLIIGGAVIVCIADFVAKDFSKLHSLNHHRVARVKIIRIILTLVGIFLALVGLFAYDIYPIIHNGAATGMVLLFLGLLIGMPVLVPSFSRAFFGLSYGLVGTLIVCAALYLGIGYFNLTAFEIISFVFIFGWLVVFIRQLAAALHDESVAALKAKKARASAR